MKLSARVKRYMALARTRSGGFDDAMVIEEMDRIRQALNPSELRYIEHNEPTRPGLNLHALLSESRHG